MWLMVLHCWEGLFWLLLNIYFCWSPHGWRQPPTNPHVPRLIMRPWLRIANCNSTQHFQLIRYTRPNLRQRPTPVPSRSCSPLCVAPAFEPTRFWHLAFCSVVAASPPGGRFPRDAMLDDGIGQGSGNLDKHLSMQAHWGGCLRHSG